MPLTTRPRYSLADVALALPGLPKGFLARLPDVLPLKPTNWIVSSSPTDHGGEAQSFAG
ncbi:hypothetical protein [Streptomyces sp. NPDC048340]|uniref:hypothetical protein n=1 Tax=Streptomyces sp. NPDC048340 TaxID=3365537 RepID=UPI003712250E